LAELDVATTASAVGCGARRKKWASLSGREVAVEPSCRHGPGADGGVIDAAPEASAIDESMSAASGASTVVG